MKSEVLLLLSLFLNINLKPGENFTHSRLMKWRGRVILASTSRVFFLDPELRRATPFPFPGTRLMGEKLQGDFLFIPTVQGFLSCMDLKTGRKRWVFRARDSFFAAPLVLEDSLWIGSAQGFLFKLNLKEGSRGLKLKLKGPVYQEGVVAWGRMFFKDIRGNLYGLSREGKILCSLSSGETGGGPMVKWGSSLAVPMGDKLILVDRNCRRKGEIRFRESILPAPVVWKNSLVVASGGKVARFSKEGRFLWSFRAGKKIVAEPVPWKDFLLIVDSGGNFYVLNDRGERIYEFRMGEPSYTPPLVFNGGKILLLSINGKLIVLQGDKIIL